MLDTAVRTSSTYSDMESEINNLLAERAITKASEYRKVIKPLLEKRRRARINHCLTELKDLLLDTYKADISEPSKLEKADILELTVRHLRDIRRQPPSPSPNPDDYRAGYNECAQEITACLPSLPGLDAPSRHRLFAHLTKCVRHVNQPRQHQHHHHHHQQQQQLHVPEMTSSPSLTPPPSPLGRCVTPPQQQQHYPTPVYSAPATPPCHEAEPSQLPTGYVSLAVLMSHKMTEQTTTSTSPLPSPTCNTPVWRPW